MTRLIPALATAMLVLGACTSSGEDGSLESNSVDASGGASSNGASSDGAAVTDEVDALGCDRETIGEQDGALVSALAVADGEIVGLCFGSPDERLERAWDELVAITPDAELADIDLVAGFDQAEGDTLAFASMIGDSNDEFVVAINLPLAENDPEELRVTLAHEVSHVFAQTPDQLDVSVSEDDCDTFFNGNGCLLADSYVMQWIDTFWSADELASLPDPTVADEEGADDRCSLNSTFLGAYAASHPEEDFAESFSAFVFDLDVSPSVQPKLDFFEQFPELVDFRTKVEAEGEPPPPNNFDGCG